MKNNHFIGITGFLAIIVIIITGMVSPQTVKAEEDTTIPSGTVYLPLLVRSSNYTAPQPEKPWLTYLNSFRAMAGLPPVTEVEAWGVGGFNHSKYIVKNDVLEHSEDKDNPWYTPEGLAAAQASNLAANSQLAASDYFAIDAWMQAPLHALGILDPALLKVGFGSYREADGGLQMGASLNVIDGLGEIPASVNFPVRWPDDGATVPLAFFWGEAPNPLTSCPGYQAPVGLPVILQIGPGVLKPQVSAHSFNNSASALEHCIFTEETYTNPDKDAQSLARAILDMRDAVVLIPKEKLNPGETYTVALTVNGADYVWSFTISASAQTSLAADAFTLR